MLIIIRHVLYLIITLPVCRLCIVLPLIVSCNDPTRAASTIRIEWKTALPIFGVQAATAQNGDILVCGYKRVDNLNGIPAVALVTSAGVHQWTREYSDLELYQITWVDSLVDGGIVAVASTKASFASKSDVCVLRMNNEGAVIWVNIYGGPGMEHGLSIEETSNRELLVCGVTNSFGAGETDAYVLRLASTGSVVWERTYGGEGSEGQYDDGPRAFETKDGGFVVVGCSNSKSINKQGAATAVYVVRADVRGEKLWERSYGIAGGCDIGSSAIELEDGGLLIAGTRYNVRNGLYAIRTNTLGEVLWEKTIPVMGVDGHVQAVQSLKNGYILGNQETRWRTRIGYICNIGRNGEICWEKYLEQELSNRVVHVTRQLGEGGGQIALCIGPERESFIIKFRE